VLHLYTPGFRHPCVIRRSITDKALRSIVNQARAMRILEIMNDFRTVQLHISSHVSRAQANPPDQASYYHDGYVVLRQCSAEAQAILATHFNPGSLGLQAGAASESEVQKATMQRSVIRTTHVPHCPVAITLMTALTGNLG
jgi:hypothetical protein